MAWLILICAILSEVGATMSLVATRGFTKRRWIAPMVVGYLTSFTLLGLVLARGIPVGVAYGIWAAAGVALTAILGRVLFGDPFNRKIALGIVLIGVGVIAIETGAH